ncbi:MAG: hypothetical protein CMF48_04820 [Legionellales bacterium]|nr:hypothetical protein [Legionellales bacterium]
MRHGHKKTVAVIVGAFLLFSLIEGLTRYLYPLPKLSDRTEGGRLQGDYFTEDYFVADSVLGYMPPASSHKRAIYKLGGYPIYDVYYTTDEHGLRVTEGNPNSHLNFIFLGCGMTFGEGLNDADTIANQFSHALGGQYKVLNYGVNGYGPHHILRLIESGKLQEKIENDIGSVYYETSPSHMVRSYVPVDWDLYGPHYTLARDGKEVKYLGHKNSDLTAAIIYWLSDHCHLFQLLRNQMTYWLQKDKESMMWLYLNMIKQTKKLVETSLQSEFKVVFWDEPFIVDGEDLTPYIIDFFERESVSYTLASDIFHSQDYSGYVIPYDGHPTARANKIIGQYLANDWKENI